MISEGERGFMENVEKGGLFLTSFPEKAGRGGRRLRYELITKPGMALDINSVNLSSVLGVKQPLIQRYLI